MNTVNALVFAIAVTALVASAFPDPIHEEWKEWKARHGKMYAANNGGGEAERFQNFVHNRKIVDKLNAESISAYGKDNSNRPVFAMTKFADMSPEEWAAKYLRPIPAALYSKRTNCATFRHTEKTLKSYPSEKDWRKDGAVNAVKDQGMCGSCWAFSTVCAMEGAWYLKHSSLPVLSEQQHVDCDQDCMWYMGQWVCNEGCNGGLMPAAMNYTVRMGSMTDSQYPYTAMDGPCKYNASKALYNFTNWTMVGKDDTDMMAALCEYGPLSVAVDASNWQFYSSGIYSQHCGHSLNHGVGLVGYGTEGGVDYWIVRNSWSASWGESGYIRLIRGRDQCGINELVSAIMA